MCSANGICGEFFVYAAGTGVYFCHGQQEWKNARCGGRLSRRSGPAALASGGDSNRHCPHENKKAMGLQYLCLDPRRSVKEKSDAENFP